MITNDVILIIKTETTDRTRMSLSDKSEIYQLAALFEQGLFWEHPLDLPILLLILMHGIIHSQMQCHMIEISFAQETSS